MRKKKKKKGLLPRYSLVSTTPQSAASAPSVLPLVTSTRPSTEPTLLSWPAHSTLRRMCALTPPPPPSL